MSRRTRLVLWMINRPGAVIAASGSYFMGRKSTDALPDRELISAYKSGAQDDRSSPGKEYYVDNEQFLRTPSHAS